MDGCFERLEIFIEIIRDKIRYARSESLKFLQKFFFFLVDKKDRSSYEEEFKTSLRKELMGYRRTFEISSTLSIVSTFKVTQDRNDAKIKSHKSIFDEDVRAERGTGLWNTEGRRNGS